MSSQYQPWPNPDVQAIAGLNSAMVFGENIQCCTGVNHQIAVGSNIQVCVNPGTLIAMMGGPKAEALNTFLGGGGLGGNMQFTLGTNTQVNWGKQFQINMSGETIQVDQAQQTTGSKALCAVIGALCIVYAIAYGACPDENGRADIVIVFQVAMDVLLAAFMAWQKAIHDGNQLTFDGIRTLFTAAATEHTSKWENAGVLTAAALTGVLGALVAPLVLVATEENHFAAQQSQTQSAS